MSGLRNKWVQWVGTDYPWHIPDRGSALCGTPHAGGVLCGTTTDDEPPGSACELCEEIARERDSS